MAHKSTLSKNVLGMKFMQRTKEKIEEKQEIEVKVGHKIDDAEGSPEIQLWPTEDSFAACEDLLFGRLSFQGYNPEIEVLMEQKAGHKKKRKTPDEEDETETEVSAKTMARRYAKMDITTDSGHGQKEGVKRKRSQYIQRQDDSD